MNAGLLILRGSLLANRKIRATDGLNGPDKFDALRHKRKLVWWCCLPISKHRMPLLWQSKILI